MGKKKDRLEDLRQMLIEWRNDRIGKATINYHYIETEPDGFIRGYQAALHAVITKIEDQNY